MKKRGAYQQRKERMKRLSNCAAIILSVIVLIAFFGSALRDLHILKSWSRGEQNRYSGAYSVEKIVSRGRHVSVKYVFSLENGDVVTVRDSMVDNDTFKQLRTVFDTDRNNTELSLVFTYPSTKSFGSDSYDVFILTDADGNDYVSESMMIDSVSRMMHLCILLGCVVLIILVGYLVFSSVCLLDKEKRIYRKYRKRKK